VSEPDASGLFSALTRGASKRQKGFLIRVLVELGMVGTLWYILFGCAFLNIAAPFASASEVAQLKGEISQLQTAANISATINLANEIRRFVQLRCTVTDTAAREDFTRYIESRQQQYWQLTRTRYPEGACSS
jgi:hypothetical protein